MKLREFVDNKKGLWIVKIIICLGVMFLMVNSVVQENAKTYQSYDDYNYQGSSENIITYDNVTEITQGFVAQGNILSNLEIYLTDINPVQIEVSVLDSKKNILCSRVYEEQQFSAGTWNSIGVDLKGLTCGKVYYLKFRGTNVSDIAISGVNVDPTMFNECRVNGNVVSGMAVIGVQGTRTYVAIGQRMNILIHAFIILVLGCMACYVVTHFETIYKIYRGKQNKGVWSLALYFSLLSIFCVNPLSESRNTLLEFKRIIGQSINDGIDIARRVSNFNRWFLSFAMAYIIFYLFACYVKHICISDEQLKVYDLLNKVIVIALVLLGVRSLSFFASSENMLEWLAYSDYILFLIIVFAGVYIFFKLDRKITSEEMQALLFLGCSSALPITIIASTKWFDGKSLLGFQYIIVLGIIFGIVLVPKISLNKKREETLKGFAVFFSFIPFLLSVYIETIAILNQHRVFVVAVKRYFLMLVILLSAVAIVIVTVFDKKKKTFFYWKKIAYPIFIIGISLLWCQIPISAIYNADIFETANSSVLISDFLNYGDIPIVQQYGGHMMTGVWEGILYGLLNNDFQGAIFSPYAGYVAALITILFYYLIKHFLSEDSALLMALMFPFYGTISYWGLGICICLATALYIKKNTYIRAAILWLAFIWCALYRLDLGFSFFVACLISLVIYVVIYKNKIACKQLTLTLLGWVLVGVIVWFSICTCKNIDPIKRLLEFLSLNMSNYNWAYSSMGNVNLTNFAWAYIMVPLAVLLGVIYLIFSGELREKMGKEKWIIVLVLGFAYVCNFSRGLVRHSLAEGILYITIWTAYPFLAIMLAYLKKSPKRFIPYFTILILVDGMLLSNDCFSERSIVDNAIPRIGEYTDTWIKEENGQTYWTQIANKKEVIDRVVCDNELQENVDDYRILIDLLLDKDETFIDFMNRSFLYSALDRQDPAYVSQSPLQISGEYTQECFINQISGIPLVLMPYDKESVFLSETMDGISNIYRYYKVSEYIYRNYMPLCIYDDKYALWCLPDRYDAMAEKIKACEEQVDCSLVQYGYDGPYKEGEQYTYLPGIHQYDLNKLPVIWAESDTKNATANSIIENLETQEGIYIYKFQPNKQNEDGNYIKVHIDYEGNDLNGNYEADDENILASLDIGKFSNGIFDTKFTYNFTVLEGQHDYIFRVSSDYYWYSGDTNAVKLNCDEKISNVNISILEGD